MWPKILVLNFFLFRVALSSLINLNIHKIKHWWRAKSKFYMSTLSPIRLINVSLFRADKLQFKHSSPVLIPAQLQGSTTLSPVYKRVSWLSSSLKTTVTSTAATFEDIVLSNSTLTVESSQLVLQNNTIKWEAWTYKNKKEINLLQNFGNSNQGWFSDHAKGGTWYNLFKLTTNVILNVWKKHEHLSYGSLTFLVSISRKISKSIGII